MLQMLRPSKQKLFNKRIFGFDIETANDNKDFVIASIVSDEYKRFFYDKDSLIQELKTNVIFRDSVIFATNLGFDFFGTFYNDSRFFMMRSGGRLICAKSYFYRNEMYPFSRKIIKGEENNPKKSERFSNNCFKSLTFLDSMNYACLSVEDMGQIINIHKKEKPVCFGRFPKDDIERVELEEYNYNDSFITYSFMKFFIHTINLIGGTFKITIGSNAIALFRNKYLDDKYMIWPKEILDIQFNAYYGGRTEAFRRGRFGKEKTYFYYDFNSLYPSVMHDNVFPDPNTLVCRDDPKYELIGMYEGISEADIYCPYMKYPLLPVRRKDGRVIFPIGKIHGWYTHAELREAERLGYIIEKVYKMQYFKGICCPFREFISDMYKLRNEYKKENNIMELIIKLIMNSTYGKFGEKYRDKEEWQHVDNMSYDELAATINPQIIGEYVRFTKDREPSSSCIPIWAAYITAYGRIKLHREIVKHNAVYCDTDSIMIDHEITESDKLGEFKKEMNIIDGYIIRPKFYALKSDKYIKGKDEHIKLKGLPMHLTLMQFYGLLEKPLIYYDKFTTFKEAARRMLKPNEIVKTHKEFNLEDQKRRWPGKINLKVFQDSEPLYYDYRTEDMEEEARRKELSKKYINYDEFIDSDLFDISSVGSDITAEEFIKNEIRGELDE